ncbi:hypothetical protein B566_EDAN012855 [Ephemera danica]|nr:hypothetical protein B566_EDAN012855 [Ephemera danica]
MSSSDIDSPYSSGSDFTDVSSLSSNEARDLLLDVPRDVASADLTHDCANLRHSNGVTTRLQLGEKNQNGNKKSKMSEFNTTAAGKNRIYGRPARGRGLHGGHAQTSERAGDQEDRDLRLLSAALSALEASQNSSKSFCRSLALQFTQHDGDSFIRNLDLPDLSESTDVEALATTLASTELGPRHEGTVVERLRVALSRLQRRHVAEHQHRDFQLERTICGHLLPLTNVAFAPRSHRCATGSYDRTCRIWNIENGEEVACLQGHRSVVFSIAFSFPLGERVATGSFDRTVRVWNSTNAEPLLEVSAHTAEVTSVRFSQEMHVLRAHTAPISSLQFSADGRRLTTGSLDSKVCVWDTRATDVEPIYTLVSHTAAVSALAMDSAGQLLASASMDTTARLWDLRKPSDALATLREHSSEVCFSRGGVLVLSAGADATARVWRWRDTGTPHQILAAHQNNVFSTDFAPCPEPERVITAAADNSVCIWRAHVVPHSDILPDNSP